MLLMTELQLLAAMLLLLHTADWRDVTDGGDADDEDDHDDDDGMSVSRDIHVDASDSELEYKCCSLIRLQQLRTAVKQPVVVVEFFNKTLSNASRQWKCRHTI